MKQTFERLTKAKAAVLATALLAAEACGEATRAEESPAPQGAGKSALVAPAAGSPKAQGEAPATAAAPTPTPDERSTQSILEDPFIDPAAVTDAFHKLYYYSPDRTWTNTRYLGVNIYKNPMDMWVYQEILWEVQPDVVIEAGTAAGGSAFFMADHMDKIGKGRVVTIDIEGNEEGRASFLSRFPGARYRPDHPRIEYMKASSTDPATRDRIAASLRGDETVLVILDSDHHGGHVLSEMRLFANLVSKDSYLIVEDTNLCGHPVAPEGCPGPMEGRDDFLAENDDFVVDASREKYFVTQNPGGFLRRVTPRPPFSQTR